MAAISVRPAQTAETMTVACFVHALLDELSGGKAPAAETILRNAQVVLAERSVVALIAYSGATPVGAPHQPEWARTLSFCLRNGFDEVGPRLRRVI